MLKGWSGRDIVKRVLRIGQRPTHVPPFLPNPGFPNQAVQEITSSLPMFEKGSEFKLLHQNRRDIEMVIRQGIWKHVANAVLTFIVCDVVIKCFCVYMWLC